jgi:phosphatidylglycerol lysyltransferase
VIPAEQVPDELPALRRISDTWLRDKRTREKGFSLGAFDDHYVTRFPAALVRSNGQLVAFASLWCSGGMEEIQVDLMRYTAAAPPGVMRYLMIEAMLWGRASGYRWFNLGMAPLSGLRSTAVAPLWLQLGRVVYGYGERFYNFQGVRTFKEWFYPVWEPKYLVSPGSVSRPVVLANIASLIAGGLGGVVRR